MTIKECKDGLLKLEDLVYETHQWLEVLETTKKELIVYKKALEMACEELETHPYSQWNTNEWFKYFSQKARED